MYVDEIAELVVNNKRVLVVGDVPEKDLVQLELLKEGYVRPPGLRDPIVKVVKLGGVGSLGCIRVDAIYVEGKTFDSVKDREWFKVHVLPRLVQGGSVARFTC